MQKTRDKMHKKTLLENVDKIHTTEMGVGRIQRNLGISEEPVGYCISRLKQDNSIVRKEGKNYYDKFDDLNNKLDDVNSNLEKLEKLIRDNE